MIDYTKIDRVDSILNSVEELLTEQIGRYEAQRFIALFCDLAKYPSQKPRNVWKEIYEAGQNSPDPNKSVTEK